MIKINVEFLQIVHVSVSIVLLGVDSEIVQKPHTAGAWPHLYEALRGLGQEVADWFAPPSKASAISDYYENTVERPV